ncbi:MAG: ABC transporter, permease protein 1 (cluster 5, nickel/peptides/opines) [uncultured Paraburkholderia sp.]|nr:MAG: ABC transporter, permease protein 1 (cluster 5, nickel/peptides/opines) [uncultured Paraburkholderia sp.]
MSTTVNSPASAPNGNAGRVARFLATRVGLSLITLWLLSVIVFAGGQLLPGDIGRAVLGPLADPRAVAALNHQLGADRPLLTQYAEWIAHFVRGDMGLSYAYREPVGPFIADALVHSAKLGFFAFIVVVPLGIAGGVWSAMHAGRWLDRTISIAGLSATVVPEFVSSIVLILVFGVWLRWLPIEASYPPEAGALEQARHLILPVLPLVLVFFGYIARMARAGTVEALDADYTRTAILKGLPQHVVIGRMCERVGVLYAGKLVEEGATEDVFTRPRHPYTVGLLRCLPTAGRSKDSERLDTIAGGLPAPGSVTQGCIYAERCRLADERCRREAPPYRVGAAHGDQMSRCHYHERAIELPRASAQLQTGPARDDAAGGNPSRALVLRAEKLSKTFHVSGTALRAVDNVSLDLAAGETLGLVGESDSGKTTLAKLMLGLLTPDAGSVLELDGAPLAARVTRRNDEQVKSLQIVFQNPDSALNRAHSVKRLIGRALSRLGALRGAAIDERPPA